MKQNFEYGIYSYEYYIEFGNRKLLGLVIQPDMRIIVRAPLGSSISDIEAFLIKKWQWLEKRLSEFRKYHKKIYDRQYISGESYHYLGRQYLLLVEKTGSDSVRLERGKIRIFTTKSIQNSDHNKKLLENWFDSRRTAVFKKQYIQAYKNFNYDKIPQLKIREMSRRWGSCSSDGKAIYLNPKLIQAPTEAIYYVAVHELCHVNNKKHDKAFYGEIEKIIPNWRQTKERLEVRYG